jgi:hypothetical protein
MSRNVDIRRISDGAPQGAITFDATIGGAPVSPTAIAVSYLKDELYVGLYAESLGLGAVLRIPLDGSARDYLVSPTGNLSQPWMPRQLVVEQDTGDLFIRASGEKRLWVARATGGSLEASPEVCDFAAMALKLGRMFVACREVSGATSLVKALSTSDLSVFSGGIPISGRPTAIAHDNERDLTYVASDSVDGALHYITRFSFGTYQIFPLPSSGAALAADSVAGDVYVAFSTANKVYVPDFSVSTPTPKREYLDVGSYPQAIVAVAVNTVEPSDFIFQSGFE